MKRRLGAIDIGSNTVKLLIAESDGNSVEPLLQKSIQTRLARGLKQGRSISEAACEQTHQVIQQFLDLANQFDVEQLTGCATSALREANNGNEILTHLSNEFGFPLRVISGKEEARLIYQGLTTASHRPLSNLLILDVGGGSTEAILVLEEQLRFQESFPVGTVHLFESVNATLPSSDKAMTTLDETLTREYRPLVQAVRSVALDHDFQVMAAGGGAVVASMILQETNTFDPRAIEAEPIELTDLVHLKHRLWNSTREQRLSWPGMPSDRADIMPTGVSILTHLLTALDRSHIHVSTRGLRFGLILQLHHQMADRPESNSSPN